MLYQVGEPAARGCVAMGLLRVAGVRLPLALALGDASQTRVSSSSE